MDRERIRKLAMTNTEIPDYHPLLLWWTWWSTRFKPIFNTLFRLSLRFRLGRWVLFRTYFDNNGTIEGDFHKYVLRPMYQDPRKVDGHRRFLNGWEWDLLDQMEWLHGIIAMPTRLMWGENDKNFPVAKAEVMAEQFPHGCIVEKFADAELAVHEDQPKLLAEALTKFYLP